MYNHTIIVIIVVVRVIIIIIIIRFAHYVSSQQPTVFFFGNQRNLQISCLLGDNWLICIISTSNVKLLSLQQSVCRYLLQKNV